MDKVFVIAGLGADCRAYDKINIEGYEKVCINWLPPAETDTLSSYAQELIKKYNISKDAVIIGNSLGGMLAVEIARIVPQKKVILISSIKTVDEAPAYFKLFRRIPVHKLIPGALIPKLGFMIRFMFGKMNLEDERLFHDMLIKSSPTFMKWAMGAVLRWDNRIVPANVYQVIGDKDHVFDSTRIKDGIVVQGGTHIMIFDRAEEINRILETILNT